MESLTATLPSLLAATVAFAIGSSVVLRDRKRDDFVLYGVFCFNLGLYHLASFFAAFGGGNEFFSWIAQTVSLVLPWSADRCFSSLIPVEPGTNRTGRLRTSLLLALLLAQTAGLLVIFQIAPLGLSEIDPEIWRYVSWGLNLYVIVGLLLVGRQMWRAAAAAEGTTLAPRLRYLFFASLIALTLGSPLIPAVGPIITAVYLYFVAQTIQRDRLLELPEVIARIATLGLLVIGATSVFALLLIWIPLQPGASRSLLFFNVTVASYAVIVLLEPVRTAVESRIETLLFRDRSALRSVVITLRAQLLNVIDPNEMVQAVVDALRDSNRVTHASLFLLDPRGAYLSLRGEIEDTPVRRLDFATRRPLLELMRRRGALLRDVLQRDKERSDRETNAELAQAIETMGELGASLAVPILGRLDQRHEEPEVLGALFVDDERLLEPFAREEVDLFQSLAIQAAITLQNSAVYEKRKERDRLAALGEMAAGLAHEIRNPLGAIKGAVQIVQPDMKNMNPTTAEFLGVIVEEVDRLNRVVTQFLTYSRPYKGELDPVDITLVLAATVRLVPPEHEDVVRAEFEEELPLVQGDADALQQVFHNLVLNALDAIFLVPGEPENPPSVVLSARLRPRGLPSGDAIAISVRDNGPGLSNQTITNLFVPFHTTKSGGTGLGLPISQRIVENHLGVFEVGNNAEGGASFTVILPVDVDAAESSLDTPLEPKSL